MFDSVLEKTPPQRRVATGTAISVAVHGALIAAIAVLTTHHETPKPPPPRIVFPAAAKRAPALGASAPAARATQPPQSTPRPKRANAIIPPKQIPTETRETSAEPPAEIGTNIGPPGVPGGDPNETTPGGEANGTGSGPGDGQGEGSEVMVFGPGMTRPQLPPSLTASLYSREAYEAHVEGVAIIKCKVFADGSIHDCRTIKTVPFLSDALISRLHSTRATPSTIDGHPVSVDYVFNFNLKLPR